MTSPGGVLIIAEAGVNHDGDVAVAERLVDAAADAGADAVKFQTFTADQLVVAGTPKAEYQTRNVGSDESQYAMLHRLELSREAHVRLIARARARRIRFLSSAFSIPALEMLVELGVDLLKVPSGEITNLPYLRCVAGFGKPVILSTGMATMDEIGAALNALERAGTPREQITVLHCTTEYPAPMTEVNLRAMLTLRDTFGVAIGYSDHTEGIEVPIAAVALGATVIEKHFTLDRGRSGPDHKASLEPPELQALVRGIRNVERALGDRDKHVTPSEARNRTVARRSLVAATSIRAGELFSEGNVTAKRPGSGLSPMQWDEVIGRRARRDFQPDELIEL